MYRWDAQSKEWLRRSRDTTPSVGRLIFVHPTSGELFYLRMLLCHQRGCTSYAAIRTVNSCVYPTFRHACGALGLLGDDREWWAAFDDASKWATASQLRDLFCHLLLICDVTDPLYLWENGWRLMSDDIVRTVRISVGNSSCISDNVLQQYVLVELEKIFASCTPSKTLSDFNLPIPSASFVNTLHNRLLLEERSYDVLSLHEEHLRLRDHLNVQQNFIYQRVCDSYVQKRQLLLFVYGHGGTGKTFLWKTILSFFRPKGEIVLAVAASGIASLLLPPGRTAHSRLKIPIDLLENSVCHIKKKTQLAELLLETKAIIWDEETMSSRKSFECVDRSLRDILEKPDSPFGGITMLLGGDFRQTLPVMPKKPVSEIIDATLPNSVLLSYFTICPLLYNMRLIHGDEVDSMVSKRQEFASWLLDIGNGVVGQVDPTDADNTFTIEIPAPFLISGVDNCLELLIDFVYGYDVLHSPTLSSLCSRAIVCPKNETADEINSTILNMLLGNVHHI